MKRLLLVLGFMVSMIVVLRSGATLEAQGILREPLFPGCNNIAITHDPGTPIAEVARGISGNLQSIFRYDNASGRFFGWAPGVPAFAIDYPTVVQRLEPVFICMNSNGQIAQPDPFGAPMMHMGTPTPTRTPTPTATPTMRPTMMMPAMMMGVTCHPSYPTVCIPPPPPDLDCEDIPFRNFPVLAPDPHDFDTDHDGIGCRTFL